MCESFLLEGEKTEEKEVSRAKGNKTHSRNSPNFQQQKKKTSCGADALGRPVIYSVLSLARGSRDVHSNTQHMTSVFEGAIRMMEHQKQKMSKRSGTSSAALGGGSGSGSGSGAASPSAPLSPVPSASSSDNSSGEAPLVAEQWIWVSDMHGFVSFVSFFFNFFQFFFSSP